MKEFLSIVSLLIGQLEQCGEYDAHTLQDMKRAYDNISETAQSECLKILADIFNDYKEYAIYFLSTLLRELKDVRIVPYIEQMIEDEDIPLWKRISGMYQLKITVFACAMLRGTVEEYQNDKRMYTKIMYDIRRRMETRYSYIPYLNRKKRVVIVVNQLLGYNHAPTRKVIAISKYLKALGYDVKVDVCFYHCIEKIDEWYKSTEMNNFLHESGRYTHKINDTEIRGFNLLLNSSNYIWGLQDLLGRIWDEKPEWILELGDKTLIGDLCRDFTSVVTMGCTKAVPVTNALLIARYFTYSAEEEEQYSKYLGEGQRVVDVKHTDQYMLEMPKQVCLQKSDFGISEQCFTIIIAGNRLDTEVSDSFLEILYQILEKSRQIVIACIGNCDELQLRIADQYKERVFFLGYAAYFRETIAIGDLFLNPPRQGGGTGGLFAIMEQIPVITLDHCDVADVGKEFTCESIEEMPQLVERYYLDHNFMKRQKEVCLENAKKLLDVDSVENFRKLCNVVKEQTLRRENNAK